MYADISVKLTQRLSSFVPNDTTFFIPRDPNDDFFYDSNALWQGFFGAAPGHPVLKKVMEKVGDTSFSLPSYPVLCLCLLFIVFLSSASLVLVCLFVCNLFMVCLWIVYGLFFCCWHVRVLAWSPLVTNLLYAARGSVFFPRGVAITVIIWLLTYISLAYHYTLHRVRTHMHTHTHPHTRARASTSFHSFINCMHTYTLLQIIEHCHMCFYGDDPLAVTGPTLVGKVVAEYLGTSNLTVGTYADPWLENGKMVIFDAKREDDGQITVFNKQGRSIGERDPASVVAEVYFPGFRAEMNLISSGATYVHYTLYWVADNVYRAVGPCGQIALSQKRAESMFNEDGTPSQYYWNRVNTRIGNLKLQRASYREWGQLDVIRAELIQQAAVEREQRRVNKKTKLIVRRVGHGRGRGH